MIAMHPSERLRSRASEPTGPASAAERRGNPRIHSLFRLRMLGVVLATPPSVLPPAPATQPAVQAPASEPAVTLLGTTASVPVELYEVTLRGRAENAKLAAALVTDQGVVYLIELPAWPADQVGRQVEVTGTYEVTDRFKAQVAADGSISQGTLGGDALLRGAKIKVLDP